MMYRFSLNDDRVNLILTVISKLNQYPQVRSPYSGERAAAVVSLASGEPEGPHSAVIPTQRRDHDPISLRLILTPEERTRSFDRRFKNRAAPLACELQILAPHSRPRSPAHTASALPLC